MPISKTKELAKKLGLLKKRKAAESDDINGDAKKRRKGQLLSYVIVIDFESTCWKDKKGAQEVIEFPAVLLDLSSGATPSEFHHYVMPLEKPRLSDFCTELTGITQEQVDSGVPLPTCLMLFRRWVQQVCERRSMCLMEPGRDYGLDTPLCALATWTDWDLEVCLNYECRRKQIKKPPYFNQWINLKALYKEFYERRPSGLVGALEDLGIAFTGRQHSGLDDARNTAKLCYRMARDGCKLNITKCIDKARSVAIKPPSPQIASRSTPNLHCKTQQPTTANCEVGTSTIASNDAGCVDPVSSKCEEEKLPRVELETTNGDTHVTENVTREDELVVKETVHQCCTKSVVSPERLQSETEGSDAQTGADAGWSFDDDFITEIAHELDKWENGANLHQGARTMAPSSADSSHHRTNSSCHNKQACVPASSVPLLSNRASVNISPSISPSKSTTPCRSQQISHVEPVTLLPQPSKCQNKNYSNTEAYGGFDTRRQKIASACTPTGPRQEFRTSPDINELFSPPIQLHNSFTALKSDTHLHRSTTAVQNNTELNTPSPSTCSSLGQFRTPSTAEWMKVKRPQQCSPRDPLTPINGGKITPPLCSCGRRTKRKVVVSPGPNEGKPFYSCPLGRGPGCGYFKWESSTTPQTATSQCSPEIFCEYD